VNETDIVHGCELVILGEAVGGFVESVNKLGVLAPVPAVLGLVACISTAVVVAKRRNK